MTKEERKEMIEKRHAQLEARIEEITETRNAIHFEWFGMLSEYGFGFKDLFTAYVLACKELERAEYDERVTRGSDDSAHDYAYSRLCAARGLFLPLDCMISCVCSRLDVSHALLSK